MSHLYRMKRTMLIFEISFHTAIKQHMKYSKLWCKQHGGKSREQQQLFGPTVKSRGSKKHSSEGKHFILAHHLITVITANYHRKEGWKSTKTTWKYQSSSICLLKDLQYFTVNILERIHWEILITVFICIDLALYLVNAYIIKFWWIMAAMINRK